MTRIVLTSYLVFAAAFGSTPCCCAVSRLLAVMSRPVDVPTTKSCCDKHPTESASCCKSHSEPAKPGKTPSHPSDRQPCGCCVEAPTAVVSNNFGSHDLRWLDDAGAVFIDLPDLSADRFTAASEVVPALFWTATDLLHVHHRLRC